MTQNKPITLSPGIEKECNSASVGQGHVIWLLEWEAGSYATLGLKPERWRKPVCREKSQARLQKGAEVEVEREKKQPQSLLRQICY